jgi:predicted O-linked N-acetylglucosamine transferase (SPINDLY family)
VTAAEALQQAKQFHAAGDLPRAEHLYRQLLAANPNDPETLNLLGMLAQQTGHHQAAAQLIGRAVELLPTAPELHTNLGVTLAALGDPDRAAACYRTALSLAPNYSPAHNNIGQLQRDAGRFDAAIASFERAAELEPDNAEVWANLGLALVDRGRRGSAATALENAVRLDPSHALAWSKLGRALGEHGRFEQAIVALRRAIDLRPHDGSARVSLAVALESQARSDEALPVLREAIDAAPDDREVWSAYLLSLHYAPTIDRQFIFDEHRKWGERHRHPATSPALRDCATHEPQRILRVGYVSGDFRHHPIAKFMEPLLADHDPSAVDVVCYSDVLDVDETTERLRGLSPRWVDVTRLNDERFAERVRADAVDILVDLSGHTSSHRLLAFGRRAAPVQVTYLGYPDTTGLPAMDYRITDAIADDASADAFHTERLVRLPRCAWCYQPPTDAPDVGPLPAERNGLVTFGSFNMLGKLSPAALDLWSGVLAAVPKSRLLLKAAGFGEEQTRRRVADLFAARSISSDRLLFRSFDLSPRDHLGAYNDVDIALDTFPYHGTTTTCDALWMGVPVVTLVGEAHVSRVGASLLDAAGLSDLAAASPERFVETAVRLANDDALPILRANLRDRIRHHSPLTDGQSLARSLENAYREMWRRQQQQQRASETEAD